jgi:hypothetical protein
MDTTVLLLVLVVVLLAAIGWLLYERRRSSELRATFGPEYQRAVDAAGGRRAAEAELDARRRRVESLQLRPLPASERDRYAAEWREVQARFVDEPGEAIAKADELIRTVMEARGYPVADFDQRVADISVDHPRVVEHYRAAHSIAVEQEGRTGQDTEALRQAMVHYRALFLDLLENGDPDAPTVGATGRSRSQEPQVTGRAS